VLPWPAPGDALPGMGPADLYLVPEGWPNALAPGLAAAMRCVVYAQNWIHLLSVLPSGVRWPDLPVSFLAVSQPVAWFIREVLHLPVAGVVRPSLDRSLYAPGDKSGKTLRIAWLPRKNKALGEQIRAIAEASRAAEKGVPPLEWLALHRLSAIWYNTARPPLIRGRGGMKMTVRTYPQTFAAVRRSAAASVFSHVNSGSSRPKAP
jgi:hypothetical protein